MAKQYKEEITWALIAPVWPQYFHWLIKIVNIVGKLVFLRILNIFGSGAIPGKILNQRFFSPFVAPVGSYPNPFPSPAGQS